MNVFLNYEIIDHLYRMSAGTYQGLHEASLNTLKSLATDGTIHYYMSQITPVEMLQGLENPAISAQQAQTYRVRDDKKVRIANGMKVIWLRYPVGKSNDSYTRTNISASTASPHWIVADQLEQALIALQGVSPGDARQVAAMRFGTDQSNSTIQFDWFVAHDSDLIQAINLALNLNQLQDLAGIRFGTSTDFVNSLSRS